MNQKFGLSETDIFKIRSVLKKYTKIKQAIIYGSRAMGNHKSGSDIDLALLAPQMTITELFEIGNELDELQLPYKIDLCLFHKIENQNLVKHIARVGIEFYPT